MDIKKITTFAMLLSLSIALSLLESMIPFVGGIIPGVKLGLANTVIIFAIYMYSFKDALTLSILRVIIVSLLKGTLFSAPFFFSLGGALLSIGVMTLVKKFTKLSVVGVSITGAISHSIGQILVVAIITNTIGVIYSLPLMMLLSIPTGLVVGLSAKEVMKVVNNKKTS